MQFSIDITNQTNIAFRIMRFNAFATMTWYTRLTEISQHVMLNAFSTCVVRPTVMMYQCINVWMLPIVSRITVI